jgi:hypothetical protein
MLKHCIIVIQIKCNADLWCCTVMHLYESVLKFWYSEFLKAWTSDMFTWIIGWEFLPNLSAEKCEVAF